MARSSATKLYNKFVKGLITEAGPLTYPEDASIDELNTVLSKKGSRSRRLGLGFEPNSTQKTITSSINSITHEFVWKSVSNRPTVNFLCLQVDSVIYFFDMNSTPLSEGLKSFSINLLDYKSPTASQMLVSNNSVQMTNGKGYLFISQTYIEPLIVEYNFDTDSIEVVKLTLQVRDFDGVDDGLANDEEPSELSKEHQYNLKNQGWVSSAGSGSTAFTNSFTGVYNKTTGSTGGIVDPIGQFRNVLGRYPGNNKQWWVAKASADEKVEGSNNNKKQGEFLPSVLDKFFVGNTRAPRGHYLLNAFFKDRSAVSDIEGLPIEVINERPSSVSFFSGRVWYSCNSTVYFSQLMDAKNKAGLCYQEADPTSEDISDLISTDGGVIPIPEALYINKILSHTSGLLVFAINGIWSITGTTGGFTAKDYSVTKVSPIGTQSPHSVVETEEGVLYWSDIGIVVVTQESGGFGVSTTKGNLTQTTIQTFYNSIPPEDRKYSKGIHDTNTNIIYWLYPQGNILCYDIALGAFYPWKVTDKTTQKVKGVYVAERINTLSESQGIIASGNTVTVNGQPLQLTDNVSRMEPSQIEYVSLGTNFVQFMQINNLDFADWGTEPYDSYVETGYELFADAMRRKQLTYVFVYLRQTETSWFVDNQGVPQLDRPSSCQMQIKWNWSNSIKSNKWSIPVEVYRPGRFLPMDGNTYDNGNSLVVTKNKVRGNGKAIQFRFGTAELGRDFELLGWSVAVTGETIP